jgi:hypothetical protein
LWRSHRSLDHPDAFTAEDFVKRAAVLAVAVANPEADVLVGEIEAEVASRTTRRASAWPRPGGLLRRSRNGRGGRRELAQADVRPGPGTDAVPSSFC